MAKKRMVSNQIVDSDDFLDMPLSAQALYLHLLVRADDEGFSNSVKKVMRMIGSRDDDLKVLVAKKFVIPFQSGVVVIKHWLIHNTIRKDRVQETTHTEEKQMLHVKPNKSYTLKTNQQSEQIEYDSQTSDTCQSDGDIDKISLDKISLDESSKDKESNVKSNVTHNVIPYKKIIDYLNEKADSNYKSKTQKTRELIKARWNEGFRLEDFKKAIDNAYNHWNKSNKGFSSMKPKTLFDGSFENRVNNTAYDWTKEKDNKKPKTQNYKTNQDTIDRLEKLGL